MSNIKTNTSLHIQNDQTGTAGVSQRNSPSQLFLEAPGGISHFTNFNDKANSLRNNGPVPDAFKKSPYYNSTESVFGFSGQNKKYGMNPTFQQDLSFITRTEKSAAIPSDIKTLDNIALVSYRNHSQEVYLANEKITQAYVVVQKYEVTGHDPIAANYTLVSGLMFPDIGTLARNVTEFDGLHEGDTADGTGKTFRRKVAPTTNGGKNVGFRFKVELDELAEFCTPDLYGTPNDWLSGTAEISFDGDLKLIEPKVWDVSIPAHEAVLRNDTGLYFSYVKLRSSSERSRGLMYNIPNVDDIPSATLASMVNAGDVSIIRELKTWDGDSNPMTTWYKVPVYVDTNSSYFYKKGKINRCGRVDVYERRTGKLTAVSGNKITVTGPSGDGTYDTELLSDGDKIKITAGLNEEPKDHIHPINGTKYVKRTASDSEYLIYDDSNFYEPTDTSGLRDVTSISWTFYDDTQCPNGAWRYKTTLFSQNGPNGSGDTDTGSYVVTTDLPKKTFKTYTNYDALEILPEAYRFGQSLDIIKQPGSDTYWLAIGEMGKAYSSTSGISYDQEYHQRQALLGAGLSNSLVLPDYGYRFDFPENEPYGRVWLYKIDIANEAILTINTAEEINASTTNPYVNAPPSLGDGDLDFELFTDYRNLYWHRALTSNFITEGRLGDLFNYNDSVYNGGWNREADKSSGPLIKRMFWKNRGKTRTVGDINYIDYELAVPSYIGEVEGRSASNTNTFFLDKVFPYYRYFNGPYGDGIGISLSEWGERTEPGDHYTPGSTMKIDWLSDGYKFADGFGHNLCLKIDDVTGGEKPIIAISDTTVPYLANIGHSTEHQIHWLQSILSKYNNKKTDKYWDENTQNFLNRYNRPSSEISEFYSDQASAGDRYSRDPSIKLTGDLFANRFKKGSIFIYNPNQEANTQVIDHTTRLHEDIVSNAYYSLPADSLSPYKSAISFVDWYGKAPSMFFEEGKLFVGTDDGNIKVYKFASNVSIANYKHDMASEVPLPSPAYLAGPGILRMKLKFSRWTTIDGEPYAISDGVVGEPLNQPNSPYGYRQPGITNVAWQDEFAFGEKEYSHTAYTYRDAAWAWAYAYDDLSDEVVAYPYAAQGDGLAGLEDLDGNPAVKRCRYLRYTCEPPLSPDADAYMRHQCGSSETVNPTSVSKSPIYPVRDNGKWVIKYNFSSQMRDFISESDMDNIILREPFGYSFKYDKSVLVAHGTSYFNEFGTPSVNLAQRLYVYQINDDATSKLIQTITPASINIEDGIDQDAGTAQQIKTFFDGSISFSERSDQSITVSYLMSGMYDIVSDRIVLMTPYETAIFADTGQAKNLAFREQEIKSLCSPYFSFLENFDTKRDMNLNDLYSYPQSEGIKFPTDVFDVNNHHKGFCAFYNVENVADDANTTRNITGLTVTVEVDENTTEIGDTEITVDSERVFPSITFYKDDPRKTITQHGDIRGSTIEYGAQETVFGEQDRRVLYKDGLQDAAYIQKEINFVRSNLNTEGWIGEVTLTADEVAFLLTTKNLIKSRFTHDRTIRNNDGTGKTDGTYLFKFNDEKEDSFDSSVPVESSLIIGLVSHNIVADNTQDVFGYERDRVGVWPDPETLEKKGGWFRWSGLNLEACVPRLSNNWCPRTHIPNKFYPPYHKPAPQHYFINNVTIKSVEASYKDFDRGTLRKFQCRSFEDNRETQAITNSFIRLGKSKTPAFFDDDGIVLDGTNSDSIEAIKFLGGSSLESDYSLAKRFDSFTMQNPEFLSLAISASPGSVGHLDLLLQGQLPTTETMTLHASGVSAINNAIPLHLGAVETFQYLGLVLPESLQFICDGISLLTPTAYGDPVSSNAALLFPGGSGIETGMSLQAGRPVDNSSVNLGIGQPAPSSGNMSIAMSGVFGVYNTIPCIQGNLLMNSTYVTTSNTTLHTGRDTLTTTETLFMGSPDPASGILGLNLNTAPLNSGLDLRTIGGKSDTTSATLYIGEQVSESLATLFLMQPHRLPFIDPESPPVLELGDSIQIPTLYVSGAVVPSANSLDNNYEHQKKLIALGSQFDDSSKAEAVIPTTNSNSISRNAIDKDSSTDYGLRRLSKVGRTLEEYTGVAGNTFYENELSRESIGHNNSLLAIGNNTNILSDSSKLQIFNVLDSSSVKLSYTYSKFNQDLRSLGIIGRTDSVELYFKDVKISTENKIAVSARVLVSGSSYHDMVFIIEDTTASSTSVVINETDECAIDPGDKITSKASSEVRWKITSAFKSEGWASSTDKNIYLHRLMGNSLSWDGEDLYYDKQGTQFASIYSRSSADSYANESLAISVFGVPDTAGYNSNINNLPEATKMGFGAKVIISGDLAFVSSPIVDPYVANNSLSGVNAASPDGAVYIFKYGSKWDYVDSVYSGGYTSANISDIDTCGYDPKLFGYDIDYSDGYLVVSEPISNTVYQFSVDLNGTPKFLNSYTNTDGKYGTFVNSLSRSLITNTSSTLEDSVYLESLGFTPEQINDEATQYIPPSKVIKSVTQEICFVRRVNFSDTSGVIFARNFDIKYGTDSSLQVQKISFAKLQDLNGTLFISGPLQSTNTVSLMISPSGGSTGDMSMHMPVVGHVSGSITSYLKVPEPVSSTSTLHMRGPIVRESSLYIRSEYIDISSNADIVVKGPTGSNGSSDLYLQPASPVSESMDMFVRGSLVGVNENVRATNLSIRQVDILDDFESQELIVAGNTLINYTSGVSLYMGAGNFGPSSTTTTLAIKPPGKLPVNHSADLLLQTDPASGLLDAALGIYLENVQTGIKTRYNNSSVGQLFVGSRNTSDTDIALTVWRQGIGGGSELFSNSSLYVSSIMDSGNANVYISGANITTGTASLSIPSGIGLATGSSDIIIYGYNS